MPVGIDAGLAGSLQGLASDQLLEQVGLSMAAMHNRQLARKLLIGLSSNMLHPNHHSTVCPRRCVRPGAAKKFPNKHLWRERN